MRTSQDARPSDVGDGPETVGEQIAAVLRSAASSAEEIRAEAARVRQTAEADRARTASLAAEAEQQASQLRREAALELETARDDREQAAALLDEARERAAAIVARAQAETARFEESFQAERERVRLR